jgi:biotin transport system substrate-specific component
MTVLVQALAPRRRVAGNLAYAAAVVVGGSLFIAGMAQISIRLSVTPVPITGQTLAVLLVGGALGLELGVAAVLLYLAQGAIGLPFFAGGESGVSLLGAASATGGYLWGFVAAAAVVGWLSRRGWDRSIRSSIAAMFLGEVVLYAIGVPWLVAALDVPLEKGLELGLYPFVIGDTIKLLVAAGVLPAAWRLVNRRGHRS